MVAQNIKAEALMVFQNLVKNLKKLPRKYFFSPILFKNFDDIKCDFGSY